MKTSIPLVLKSIEYHYVHTTLKFAQGDNSFKIIVERDNELVEKLEIGQEYEIQLDLKEMEW